MTGKISNEIQRFSHHQLLASNLLLIGFSLPATPSQIQLTTMVRRSPTSARHRRSSSVPRNAQLKREKTGRHDNTSSAHRRHLYDEPRSTPRPTSPTPRHMRNSRSIERRVRRQEALPVEEETREPLEEQSLHSSTMRVEGETEQEHPYETYSQYLQELARERKEKVPVPDAIFLPETPKERSFRHNSDKSRSERRDKSMHESHSNKPSRVEVLRGCTGIRPSNPSSGKNNGGSSHSSPRTLSQSGEVIRTCTGARPARRHPSTRKSKSGSHSSRSPKTSPDITRRSSHHRRRSSRHLSKLKCGPNKHDMLSMRYQYDIDHDELDSRNTPTYQRDGVDYKSDQRPLSPRPRYPKRPLRHDRDDVDVVAQHPYVNDITTSVAVVPGPDCIGRTGTIHKHDQKHDAKWFAFVDHYLERNVIAENAERFLFGPKLPRRQRAREEETVSSRSWDSSTYEEQDSTVLVTEKDGYMRDKERRHDRRHERRRYE